MAAQHTALCAGAQSSYAEILGMAQAAQSAKFSSLRGSFHLRQIRGKPYVYFNFRDTDGRGRSSYVGPDSPRVQALVEAFKTEPVAQRTQALAQRARACIALGCTGLPGAHFRMIHKLASYGLFNAGGVLLGTHAFLALGNALGVSWGSGQHAMEVDPTRAGANISVALPAAALPLAAYDALTSLEKGLLPLREFSARTSAQHRNPANPELRLDFCTPDDPGATAIEAPGHAGIALAPLKFLDLCLQDTTQAAVFSGSGACLVNLPDPARLAIHKLIVQGARPITERLRSLKDIEQAAALIEWHLTHDRLADLHAVWLDALSRGPAWRHLATQGRDALLPQHAHLVAALRT